MSYPINGIWRCQECGECPTPDSRWRWNGLCWQHHHGDQVGCVDATYFGNESSPSLSLIEKEIDQRLRQETRANWDNFLCESDQRIRKLFQRPLDLVPKEKCIRVVRALLEYYEKRGELPDPPFSLEHRKAEIIGKIVDAACK